MEENQFENIDSKKNKKVYAINIAIIVAIFIGILVYMLAVEGIDNIKNLLIIADYRWVVLGLLCLIGMWLAEAVSTHIPLKRLYPKQSFRNTFKIVMVGQLFNNITPFASGGQLMQSYVMYKEGKRPSTTLSILTMRFVITQTILIVFTILVILSQFGFFAGIFKDLLWLGIIGIVLNILIVVAFFLAGTNKNFVLKVAKPFIRLGAKIHIGKFRLVKDADITIQDFSVSVNNFNEQFNNIKKDKKTLAVMAIFGLLQSIFYYAITYMVYKTFGNFGATFFEIITTQAFLMLIMSVFPTPGAGLGAEGGFLILFSSIFTNGTINMSILFWRMYVFYLPILIGAFFFIPSMKKK